jgi:hypothetical protein
MVVGFTTICVYHHKRCGFESHSWRGIFDTTLCDKVFQWLATGRSFSPVSSTNKTDRHDIAEILLKVALNTITLTLHHVHVLYRCSWLVYYWCMSKSSLNYQYGCQSRVMVLWARDYTYMYTPSRYVLLMNLSHSKSVCCQWQ